MNRSLYFNSVGINSELQVNVEIEKINWLLNYNLIDITDLNELIYVGQKAN